MSTETQTPAKPKRKFPTLLIASGVTTALAVAVLVIFVGPHVGWMFASKGKVAERHPAHHEEEDEVEEQDEVDEHEAPAKAPATPHATHPGKLDKLVDTYAHALVSVQEKVDGIRRVEHDNERLKLENLRLRSLVEGLRFDCRMKDSAAHTHGSKLKLKADTGSRIGRTLASIDYSVPEHLLPQQLHTLAVTYFKKGEDEKAAKILTQLVEMEEIATFRNVRDLLMTGVAWYRLDNFQLADDYFGKALKQEATADTRAYFAQARLWRALVSEKLGKHVKAQFWLRELVDHHPHSTESKWVNRAERAGHKENLGVKARKALEAKQRVPAGH